MPNDANEPNWTKTIAPHRGWFDVPWRDLVRYRDLIWLFALRDLTATYKQTILGPLWFILQPLIATGAFTVLFSKMGQFGTDGKPEFLFYMSGLGLWMFFAECVNKSSGIFTKQAQLFGKVYFPRLAIPLAAGLTAMVGFLVQFAIFSAGLIFFVYQGANVHPNWRMIFLPGLLVQTAMLGIGLGLIISALSTRFRDLTLGAGFIIQLWMYASSVVFPISRIPAEKRALLYWNPIVPIIEGFRFAFLGSGLVEREHLWRSFGICAAIFFIGIVMFNRAEQKAMDTV